MNLLSRVSLRSSVGGLLMAVSLAGHAQTPLTLYNGTSLLGWNAHGSWTGTGGAIASSGAVNRSLVSAVPFADFSLFFDFNESAPMNAKVRVWATHDGTGGSVIDLDTVGPAGVAGIEGASKSTLAPVSLSAWHHVQITASHGQLSVNLDGNAAANATGSNTRAGYLVWEVTSNGTFQVRNVKLALAGLTSAFNGTDLGSWKTIAQTPKSKGGLGHDVAKTLTLGMAGGSTKPHSAKWIVQGGMLHGEDGPGGLEYATPVDDGIIQLQASVKGPLKPDHFTSVYLRNASGQLEGGYPVGVGPYSGEIEGLAKYPSTNANSEETIIIAGRTVALWVGGNPATVTTDSRPESAHVAQGAKTASGVVTLVLPHDAQLDVQRISVTPLPKNYGSVAAAPPPPPPAPAAGAVSSAALPPPPSATETALLQQQQLVQKQATTDRENKQKVASLMAMALSTSDPAKQMDLYNQVVQIDPSNAPAVQGYKDAQTKLQAAQASQEQQVTAEVNQQHESLSKDEQVNGSLAKAQGAFLAGHLSEAGAALSVAERLAPDNPLVRDLRSRINATTSLHSRIFYLAGGAGLLALVTALMIWFRRKRQQRFPMFEITQGLDMGQQYPVDKDTVRIGAVAQDGGQKNDIVLRDVDRAISRFHCEIAKKSGQLYITDLRSSNGTKLEGVPLPPGQPTLLRRGNRILIADSVELRFGYARRSSTGK